MIRIKTRQYKKRGVMGWEIDITIHFPDGLPPHRVRKKSPMNTERQARDWGMRLGQELAKHGRPQKVTAPVLPPAPAVMTFSAFVKEYLTRVEDVSEGSIETYEKNIRRYLLPKLGDLPLDQITVDHVSQIRAAIKTRENGTPRKARHRNMILSLLGRMLRAAYEWKLSPVTPPAMPPKAKEKKPEIEVFTDDELTRLLDVARSHSATAYLMVLLGSEAGLRVGELLGLRWSDLDLKTGRLVVRQQVQKFGVKLPKGEEVRSIKMTPLLLEGLRAHQHLNERVLITRTGEPLTRSQLEKLLTMLERRAKLVTAKSPHKLRHTFASRLLARGATLLSVQGLMGHKTLSTTLMYLHLQPGECDRAIGLLSGDKLETKDEGVER